jgi:hypothetical protein
MVIGSGPVCLLGYFEGIKGKPVNRLSHDLDCAAEPVVPLRNALERLTARRV